MTLSSVRSSRARAVCAILTSGLVAAGFVATSVAHAAPTTGSTVEIVAGNGNSGALVPGPGLSSEMDLPWRLAVDPDGDVYTAFAGGSELEQSIVRYTPGNGQVQYVANNDQDQATPVAGPALDSPFEAVDGIAVDSAGNVYASDYNSAVITKITPGGALSIVAGTGSQGAPTAAALATASAMTPKALAVGPDDTLYFLDEDTYSVWHITSTGHLEKVAGDGSNGVPVTGTGNAATASPLTEVVALALDGDGNLFISDQGVDCVVMVAAGTGDLMPAVGACNDNGAAIEGPVANSRLSSPEQIAVDGDDDLYVVDKSNGYIEKVTDPASGSGTLSFIAGTGASGSFANGPASSVPVRDVTGIAVDADLNVYLGLGDDYYLGVIPADLSVPSAPRSLSRTISGTQVTLTFLPPLDDGGDPSLTYQYSLDGTTWRPSSGTWSTTVSGGQVSGVAGGLTPGATYTFRVRAVNSVGGGTTSSTVTVTLPADEADDEEWFHDVLTSAQRRAEIAVPSRPKSYRGAQKYTRARNRAFQGQTAMPIPAIARRELDVQQAAVLADSGLFGYNSARLTTSGKRQVRALAASLDTVQAVRCEGYADYAGATWWEYKLSAARAKAVCTALRAAGVTATTKSVGYGPQRPVIVGGTAQGREANRRVVVLVTR